MLAVHQDLKPKLIEEYNKPFELIVVEVETDKQNVRIMTGVGPQENWEETKRMPFFIALESEIVKAQMAGKGVIIEIDANSKLGSLYIPNDPHTMSPNGKILAGIIDNNALIVANGSTKYKGVITRKRITRERKEESCIELLMFSKDLGKSFKSLVIDDERKHVLTRNKQTKTGLVVKESDYHVLLQTFSDIETSNKHKETLNMYNLNNKGCQQLK